MKETMTVHVIGAGLAGSEATWQLVSRGIPVRLHEMRPQNQIQPTIPRITVSLFAAIPYGPITLKMPLAY